MLGRKSRSDKLELKVFVIVIVVTLLLSALPVVVGAHSGCCPQHGGVCSYIVSHIGIGYHCCVGTSLLEVYKPYYAQPVAESPELYVNPTSLDFGEMELGDTAWDSFWVENFGDDTLEWGADWDMDWIEVYPTYGTLSGWDDDEVEVEIDTTDLEGGDFYGGYI